jgi:hypothetical protein
MLNQVFISYRRENDAHIERVRKLAELLRGRGLEVSFDEAYLAANPAGPNEGWPAWCLKQADSACVLIVGSSGWYSEFDGSGSNGAGSGCGAAAEAHVIRQTLHDMKWVSNRHRVVLLDSADEHGLPAALRGWRRFLPLGVGSALDELCQWALGLTGRGPAVAENLWPEAPPELTWQIANHHEARTTLAALLTRGSARRFLPIRGSSESGKSHITRELYANALGMPWLACGRFDFKGTTDIDREIGAFVQELGVPRPSAGLRLHAQLGQILAALKERVRPALLVFDTYEMAGEAEEWVEKQLLPSLVRASWLRVVIAGQKVPSSPGAVWRDVAHTPIQLNPPPACDWFEFGRRHRAGLKMEEVEVACRLASHRPGLLAQLLGPGLQS